MREIIFRGNNEAGKWVYGSLLQSEINTNGNCVCEIHTRFADDPSVSRHIVDPESVGQYTGLKDKNGKEIYEGDIVDIGYGRGKVVFNVGCFMLEWIDDPEANMELLGIADKYGRVRDQIEVIGNIYENPELVENRKSEI